MTDVTCTHIECLNNRKNKCMANKIELKKCKCDGHITIKGGLKMDIQPMERRNGAMRNIQRRKIK